MSCGCMSDNCLCTCVHAAGPEYGEGSGAGDVHRFVEELFYEMSAQSASQRLALTAGSRDFTEVHRMDVQASIIMGVLLWSQHACMQELHGKQSHLQHAASPLIVSDDKNTDLCMSDAGGLRDAVSPGQQRPATDAARVGGRHRRAAHACAQAPQKGVSGQRLFKSRHGSCSWCSHQGMHFGRIA